MKKTISILMSLIMLLSIFTVVPMSVSADETMYFDYRVIDNNEAEITGYTGISSFIDIPSELNGLTVTSIGDWAFNGYGRMTEVTIPDTVTNIGEGAFWECKGLKEVFIPASVTSISDSAFYDCTGITRFKVDGNNPSYRSLNGDLYDKSAATLIQYASGKATTSFTIPDSVVTVKEGTFIFSCLTEITVPGSVRNIADYAIGYKYDNNYMPAPIIGFVIKGLAGTVAKLYATDNEITFVALESDYVGEYEYTVLDDGTAEITGYAGDGGDIDIPPTLGGHFVTSLGFKAFAERSSLTEVTIPDSVTSIGNLAFYGSKNLTEVNIPDSVTNIGLEAFAGCSSLIKVTIPDSVTNLDRIAFEDCTNLTEVYIGNSVTSLGDWTFNRCISLTEVTIPDSVTTIGTAFCDCYSLTKVTIPDSVTFIDSYAFQNCTSLASVTIPASVTEINNFAFGFQDDESSHHSIKIDGFTIYGYTGTAAEKYANKYGFTFISLGSKPLYLLGDVDNDNVVGVIDSTYIQRYDAGIRIPVSEKDMLARGDVDGDGEVGVIDSTYIQRYDAGFNTPYPIGEAMN